MKQEFDPCPRCGYNLDLGPVPPEWSSFYPDQRRWKRKQGLKFVDPIDGEEYEIWKCSNCGHTWDGDTEKVKRESIRLPYED